MRRLILSCIALLALSCGDPGGMDAGLETPDAAGSDAAGSDAAGSDAATAALDAAPPDAAAEDAGAPDAAAEDAGGSDGAVCPDSDSDTVCDADDVCPDVPDLDQLDSDLDGVGDACECADVVCAPSDQCHGAGVCEPSTGVCSDPALSDGTACDDGDLCTTVDQCSSGACAGTSPVVCAPSDQCHGAGVCEPSTGVCTDPALSDGTACDDGDLCTTGDECQSGSCMSTGATTCVPRDACHTAGTCDSATGLCSDVPIAGCTGTVTVHVEDSAGGAADARIIAYDSSSRQVHPRLRTDLFGDAVYTLPAGQYWFTATTEDGVPTYSGAVGHCDVPTCTSVTIVIPDSPPYLAMSWDPYMAPSYTGGEIHPGDANVERGGIYLEAWAIDNYNAMGSMIVGGHDHVGDNCLSVPGNCDDPTRSENQHAFLTTLQGFYVRLSTLGAFDLVSLEYRIRDDSAVMDHINTIPGVDPSRVEIWVSPVLDGDFPVTMPFTAYNVGTRAGMAEFETLFFSDQDNVTGLYITSTWNVSFDNVVLRPR